MTTNRSQTRILIGDLVVFAAAAAIVYGLLAALGAPLALANLTLLDFSSPSCAPCKVMEPTVTQLEQRGAAVRHVDVTREPELAAKYSIDSVPQFVSIDEAGRVVNRLLGGGTLAELEALLAPTQTASTGSPRTPNFAVRARDPQLASSVAECAEQFRGQLWLDWFGVNAPGNWPSPAEIDVDPSTASSGGGATNIAIDAGKFIGISGHWQCGQKWATNVVPHEVMHAVLHTALGWHPPRWLDEGIASNVECPESLDNWMPTARCFAENGQAIPLRTLSAQYREMPVIQDYAQGATLVAMLLEEPQGRKGIVDLATGIRDHGLDSACQTVYRCTPEQLDGRWREWLRRQPVRCAARRLIGGLYYVFCGRQGWRPASGQQPVTQPQSAPGPGQAAGPPAIDPWRSQIETQLAGKQDKGNYATPDQIPSLNDYAKSSDIPSLKDYPTRTNVGDTFDAFKTELLGDKSPIHQLVAGQVNQAVGNIPGQLEAINAKLAPTLVSALGLPLWAGPILGATGPAGMLLAGGALLVARNRKNSRGGPQDGGPQGGGLDYSSGGQPLPPQRPPGASRTTYQSVAVDSPPLEGPFATESHYVPVRDNSYQRAHQWGREQTVRKMPGAEGAMTMLEGLIKQKLAATPATG